MIRFAAYDITRSRATGFAVMKANAVDYFFFDGKLPGVDLVALLFGASAANNVYGDARRLESGSHVFRPNVIQASDGARFTEFGRFILGRYLKRLGIGQ